MAEWALLLLIVSVISRIVILEDLSVMSFHAGVGSCVAVVEVGVMGGQECIRKDLALSRE